jgi:hypothetical protein
MDWSYHLHLNVLVGAQHVIMPLIEYCYRDSDKYTIDIPSDSVVKQVIMAVDGTCVTRDPYFVYVMKSENPMLPNLSTSLTHLW